MATVGIIGGTGYTGVELLRLLLPHPDVEIAAITSRSEAGKPLCDSFPNLRGHCDLRFVAPEFDQLKSCDIVFFATPNGTAMQQAPGLLAAGCKVIDLAADFRLRDISQWQRWYKMPHACPELLKDAVYGLPEINRSAIRDASLVANPGCHVTTALLGLIPIIKADIVDHGHIIVDSKTGVSGAGRKAVVRNLLTEASDSLQAYAVPGHRHLPEITQGLSDACDQQVALTFVPHLTPMIRGIHATMYAVLRNPDEQSSIDLQTLYERHYAQEPFVDVLPPGAHPETRSVRGSNMCRMALHRPHDQDVVIVLSVTDNLVKGAAGQAVQNMNLMLGLDETTGLNQIAMLP